jgi:hypothetical protein
MQKCAHGPAQRHTTQQAAARVSYPPPFCLRTHLAPTPAYLRHVLCSPSPTYTIPTWCPSPSPLLPFTPFLSSLCCPSHCSKVSHKYQDCKASCNSCETLRQSIQSDTGLQVRVVLELTACQDLHPSCAGWSKGGRCSKEPKAMLELCQVW